MRNEQKLLPRPGITQSSFEPSVSDALPTELSRQDDNGRNEGNVTHTGLKRRLSDPCVGKEETMYRDFSGYLPLGYF